MSNQQSKRLEEPRRDEIKAQVGGTLLLLPRGRQEGRNSGRFGKVEGGGGMLRDFTAGSSGSSSLGVGLLQREADGWPQRREGSRERLEPLL